MPTQKGHSLAKDFVGGIDPFGIKTTEYGRRAQQRKESEKKHALRRGVSTAGGVVGGAVLLPTAIGGLIGGTKSLRRGARAAIEGAKKGGTKNWKALRDTKEVIKKVDKLKDKATRQEIEAARSAVERIAPAQFRESAKKLFRESKVRLNVKPERMSLMRPPDRKAGQLFEKGQILHPDTKINTSKLYKAVSPTVKDLYSTAKAQIGLGGAVGGLGAFAQYGKGRDSEKQFQKRLKKARAMKKTASDFGGGFEESVYYIASHHPYIFMALDKLAYVVGQDAPEDEGVSPEEREEETGEKKEEELASPGERTKRLRKMLAKREAEKSKASKGKSGVMDSSERKEEPEAQKVARLSRIAYLSQ